MPALYPQVMPGPGGMGIPIWLMSMASRLPTKTPMIVPTIPSTTPSAMNNSRISLRRAPIAIMVPISPIRWITDMVMVFEMASTMMTAMIM